MKMSEGVRTALMQEAETGVLKLLENLQTLEEGDLKCLERQVMETIFTVGRGWIEHIRSSWWGTAPNKYLLSWARSRLSVPTISLCGSTQLSLRGREQE